MTTHQHTKKNSNYCQDGPIRTQLTSSMASTRAVHAICWQQQSQGQDGRFHLPSSPSFPSSSSAHHPWQVDRPQAFLDSDFPYHVSCGGPHLHHDPFGHDSCFGFLKGFSSFYHACHAPFLPCPYLCPCHLLGGSDLCPCLCHVPDHAHGHSLCRSSLCHNPDPCERQTNNNYYYGQGIVNFSS